MTLRPPNRAPCFYTLPTFSPKKTSLAYGGLLSVLAFCAITLVFNYGIRERLWSYDSGGAGAISFANPDVRNTAKASAAEKMVRVRLSEGVVLSLAGTYFSPEVNRTYVISLQQQQLALQIDTLPTVELVPIADDTLYAGEGHLIKFAPLLTGSIDRLDFYDNGRHIVAFRR